MKYEEAINSIQGHGMFNIGIMLILSIPSFLGSLDINSIIFLNYEPAFNCTDQRILNETNVTWMVQKQCLANVIRLINTTIVENVVLTCESFEYDKSVMFRTITTEFDLVCQKANIMATIDTLFFLGISFGSFVGILGDKFGRRKMILICCLFEALINILMPLMPMLWAIVIFRVLWGFTLCKAYQGICILLEIVPAKKREFFGNNIWIFWVFGYMFIPGVAYAIRDWRYLRYICCGPLIFYCFLYFIPESPRWLSVNNRKKEAAKTLVYIAKYNGVKLKPSFFDKLNVEKEKEGKFYDIFKYPILMRKLCLGILIQSTITMSYFGLSINANLISKNIFINVFAQGVIELFTGPTGWLLSSRANRKSSMLGLYCFTASSLLISGFIPRKDNNLGIEITKSVFAIFGKFALTTTFIILDMFLPEIFPTVVRNLCMFLVIGIGSLGAILAPHINRIGAKFSIVLYAGLCVTSAFLIWFLLPETKGCPLPESYYQGELLTKGNEKKYKQMMRSEANTTIPNADDKYKQDEGDADKQFDEDMTKLELLEKK